MLSPRKSFKGYRFNEALYRNKDAIKYTLSAIAGVNLVTFDLNIFLLTTAGALIALAAKLIQDAIDYYYTEVEI